jgi:hypothetical protein
MPILTTLLTWIRNNAGSLSGRGPAFWAVTVLIALLIPSPIAAPVLLHRLRRSPPGPAAR